MPGWEGQVGRAGGRGKWVGQLGEAGLGAALE